MEKDVAPILLEQIKELYNQERTKNGLIEVILAKIKGKQATYIEAEQYANELGEILAKAYKETFVNLPDGKMYYNIAKRTVEPTMAGMHSDISDITDAVQTVLNENAGLGINPIRPTLEQNKIDGILNRLSHAETFDDIAWILEEPIKTFARSTVDDAIKANAEFHAKAGMSPKIVRKMAGNCCDWCKAVAGTYIYPEVPKDVYRRHQRCRCTVDYVAGKKKQNVWNKAWSDEVEKDKIEERKAIPYGEKAKQNKTIEFTPSKTIEEAEEYAKRFVDSGGFTIGKKNVNYSGVSVDIANEINYQLTQLFGNYEIKKFDSIETFGKVQKKYWQNHGEAPLCTSNFGNLMINKEICKNSKTIAKYISDGKEAFEYVMSNMEKLSGAKLELAKRYKKAGRSLVGNTFKDMITHETGHHVSYMKGINKEINDVLKTSDWFEYASHISGYATAKTGEYIAESWTAYINGETEILDTKLIEIFERLVK